VCLLHDKEIEPPLGVRVEFVYILHVSVSTMHINKKELTYQTTSQKLVSRSFLSVCCAVY